MEEHIITKERIIEVLNTYLLENQYSYYEDGMYPHRVTKSEIINIITDEIIGKKSEQWKIKKNG